MSVRAASWLAWLLAGLSLALLVAGVVLYALARSAQAPGIGTVVYMLVIVPFLAFPVVGAMTSSRRPRNPIGWICLADGFLWMLTNAGDYYGVYGVAVPGSVPYPVMVAALTTWLWVPALGLLGTYLFLLFPDGRLPSRRWRPLAWLSGVVISLLGVTFVLTPGPVGSLRGVRNPFGLESQPWVEVLDVAALLLLLLCIFGSAMSLILRFRRSGGEVRQQIKWIALAASLVFLTYLSVLAGGLVFGPEASDAETPFWFAIMTYVVFLSFAGIPVSIGFAILKHRLYDIDVVINRALVYGVLTVTLLLTYFGAIVSLQSAFRALTGQNSDLAVVASTLAIAALFTPLRRSVQSFIDRLFYRGKYDAARTLEGFSTRLRDEVELQSIAGDLTRTVERTLQPEHVSLWLSERGKVAKPEEFTSFREAASS